MRRSLVALAALLVCLVPNVVFGQTTAAVGGTVEDSTGALIPGVDVTATNINTGIATIRITNETGTYRIPSLQPGTYTLQAELPGFQTAIYEGITLSAGSDVRYNFTLQVGNVATSIEVVAQGDQILREQSASVGAVLTTAEVAGLPTFSRNVLDLAALIPGAVVNGTNNQNYGGMRQSQINTTRDGLPTGDGRYLDWNGAYSATFTSPDLVEEVQINVTTADAAMGRGSGQVRMQTRSGTNQFHGALFYQNNNSALSSNDWFTNLVGGEKEFENRNQFGGRLGGPIVPNKAFFFVLYDGQRYVEKTEVVSTVLTDDARRGIFRYIEGQQNGDALSTTPSVDLNGNILNPAGLRSFSVFDHVNDPLRTSIDQTWVASQYLTRMPLANDWTEGDGLNTAGHRWLRTQRGTDGATGGTQTTNRDHLTVRIDYQINDDNKVSYSMTREENWGVTGQTGLPAYPGGYFGEVARRPDLYSAQWTSTLSPTIINEFRWGLKRDTWFGESPIDVGCCGGDQYDAANLSESATEASASFPSLDGNVFYIAPGVLSLDPYAPVGVATPRGSVSPLMQFADTVSWAIGAHSFQSGFELTLANSDQFNHGGNEFTRPNIALGQGNFPVPGITPGSGVFVGLDNADAGNARNLLAFLAGSVGEVNQQYFINSTDVTRYNDYRDGILFFRDFHQNDWAAFWKDTWNVTSDLTLTMGVRYDVYGTPYDSSGMAMAPVGGQAGLFGISGTGHDALFAPGASGGSLTVFDFVGKNSPNPDLQVYDDDFNNIAPSFGFSWNVPWADRATVVRGGYGISYTGAATFLQYSGALGGAPGSALPISNPPVQYADIQSSMALFPLDNGGAVPLEAVPLTNRTTNIQGYADDRKVPYVQSFNLSIQRELSNSTTLEVGYVGNKGTHLRSSQQLNAENIFENGILEAFNFTRAGGDAPLFDAMFNGITFGGVTVGTTGSGSDALRGFNTTRTQLANGEVGDLAQFLTTNSVGTGVNGGLITQNGFPDNFIVVNPQFGSVVMQANDDNSIYHSLQTSVTQRGSNFVGQFSYVWSRNLGNSVAGNANASDTTSNLRDPRNRGLQRGLVGFHRTHNFKAHGTFDLPFGPGQMMLSNAPNWVNRLVEGWQIAGVFNWTSGAPLDFISDLDTLWARSNTTTADFVGGSLADLDGQVTISDGGVVRYFPHLERVNAPLPAGMDSSLDSRFTNRMIVDSSGTPVLMNPEPGTTGNTAASLGAVEGPASLGLDMALSKRVQIDESKWFQISADVINILNTPQWDNPETDINDSQFGVIDGAGGSRTVTINARFEF
jgi:hypothetical protein